MKSICCNPLSAARLLVFPFLVLSATSVMAEKPSAPVVVVNDASAPVPVAVQGTAQVSGTVTVANTPNVNIANSPSVTVTNPVRVQSSVTPYKSMSSVADSTACAPQCYFNFDPVPAGERLVVTYISAQIPKASDSFLLDESLFVAQPYPNAGLISAPVTYYFEPGQVPSGRMFDPDTSSHTSIIVVLVGHLVPAT